MKPVTITMPLEVKKQAEEQGKKLGMNLSAYLRFLVLTNGGK